MAAPDLKVNMSMSRIESIARYIGSPDIDACPPNVECWHRRGLIGYLPNTTDNECANCWMLFILRGE